MTSPVSTDQIFVENYVRNIDIGIYDAEKGVPQRVRFSVRIDVDTRTTGTADDVTTVISYDRIIAAIDARTSGPRIGLLETLADLLAQDCLGFSGARRVSIQIAKLDRIPGAALGVEITRTRAAVSTG